MQRIAEHLRGTTQQLADRLDGLASADRGGIIHHPGVIALINHIGPFDYGQWQKIAESHEHATQVAAELIKDFSLLVEGARPGAGREFQLYVAGASEQTIDLPSLTRAASLRTQVPLTTTYLNNRFMQDVSSFLLSGDKYDNLDCDAERAAADDFPIVIDLGHFSRIMQIDAARIDDVAKSWMVDEVGEAFERGLNDAFTHRTEGAHGGKELWPVPPRKRTPEDEGSSTEGHIVVNETNDKREVVSVTLERSNEPNISFMVSITNPSAFTPQTVRESEGKGVVVDKEIKTADEMIRYLAAQLESIVLDYPVEKALLIYDKFLYKQGLSDLGIQVALIQRVKTTEGKIKAKTITVGEPGIAIFREKRVDLSSLQSQLKQLRADADSDTLKEIARQLGIEESQIPQGELTTNQKQRFIGMVRQEISRQTAGITHYIHAKDKEIALGSFIQAPHKVVELDLAGDEAYSFIPPTAASGFSDAGGPNLTFQGIQKAIEKIASYKAPGSNASVSHRRIGEGELQVLQKKEWTRDEVVGQLGEYLDYIKEQLRTYDTVFVSMQFAHFHPTGPKHTSIQEQAADIARILGEELSSMGAQVRGATLVDEYHTNDRMRDWNAFLDMLHQRNPQFANEFMQESSPSMRLIGDAHVRVMDSLSSTYLDGPTLKHKMPDGRDIELWDSVANQEGTIQLGRQACVPFNTGMDVALMHPELTDDLYKKYLVARYPQSVLAQIIQETPGITVHDAVKELMLDDDIERRNRRRLEAINEVDRDTFDELRRFKANLTAFDLLLMDELYRKVKEDMAQGRRIPVVTHVLETNYNAQQKKAEHMWKMVGIPGVPVFRISFNPENHRVRVLRSDPPKQDYAGEFLAKHRGLIEELRQKYLAQSREEATVFQRS